MDDRKTDAIWSWDYNHGKPFPWLFSKCGLLIKMEKIGNPTKTMYVKCPKCGFKEKSHN